MRFILQGRHAAVKTPSDEQRLVLSHSPQDSHSMSGYHGLCDGQVSESAAEAQMMTRENSALQQPLPSRAGGASELGHVKMAFAAEPNALRPMTTFTALLHHQRTHNTMASNLKNYIV